MFDDEMVVAEKPYQVRHGRRNTTCQKCILREAMPLKIRDHACLRCLRSCLGWFRKAVLCKDEQIRDMYLLPVDTEGHGYKA